MRPTHAKLYVLNGGRGTLIFMPLLFDALDAAEAGLEVGAEAMARRGSGGCRRGARREAQSRRRDAAK